MSMTVRLANQRLRICLEMLKALRKSGAIYKTDALAGSVFHHFDERDGGAGMGVTGNRNYRTYVRRGRPAFALEHLRSRDQRFNVCHRLMNCFNRLAVCGCNLLDAGYLPAKHKIPYPAEPFIGGVINLYPISCVVESFFTISSILYQHTTA